MNEDSESDSKPGLDSGSTRYVDPVIEAYKKDIDLTLILENLKLSVDERFEKLMALQRFADELKRAGQDIK
ncbi:MAG TPA: hypothetical protein VJX67_09645 [Blastocatellia bacterium]|nr:hypothetical protein [Blastocatellia bacterium]